MIATRFLQSTRSLLMGLIGGRSIAPQLTRNLAGKKPEDIKIPPEPTNCCMSGCANCVWIAYAKELAKLLGDNDERAREIVLSKITDPNLRAFLAMELRNLKESEKEKPKKTTK